MDGQPRRPESRVPKGPSALRAYAPARTTAAERLPRASWAFFCAADVDVDADEDDDDAVEVEKGEVARRRRGACRPRRKVATNMSFLKYLLREGESVGRSWSW